MAAGRPLHIALVYTEAGGGHHATAQALREVLQAEAGVSVSLHSLYREFAADLEWCPRLFGRSGETLYNEVVLGTRWGRLLWPGLAGLVALNVRFARREAAARLAAHWQQQRPDLVVSVMPLVNAVLTESLAPLQGQVPLATVMSDFVEAAPGAWISGPGQWLACGTAAAVRQAQRRGVAAAQLMVNEGMVIRPQFRQAALQREALRPAVRQRLGLHPATPTVAVMLGGHGSPAMLDIAQALAPLQGGVQVLFLCGRNTALAAQLSALPTPYAKAVLGYTEQVAEHLAAADVLIGKPGPGVMAEALSLGLPLVLEHNAWTLAQERHNARWAVEAGVALTVRRFGDVGPAVAALLRPEAPQRLRAATFGGRNEAAERVAAWLLGLARQGGAAAPVGTSAEG